MKNIELKAIASDLPRLRKVLRTLGATHELRPLDQIDWYFDVPHGRLKLRQRKGQATAELIFYVRPDAKKARASEYQKLPVVDAPGMLRLLRSMFPAGARVRKRRDLWRCGETRIHLDQVSRLGSFVEIEVPFRRNTLEARRVMRTLREQLAVRPGDVLDCSYADLLARRPTGSE